MQFIPTTLFPVALILFMNMSFASENDPFPVVIDSNGVVWKDYFGDSGGGVYSLDGEVWKLISARINRIEYPFRLKNKQILFEVFSSTKTITYKAWVADFMSQSATHLQPFAAIYKAIKIVLLNVQKQDTLTQ